MSRILITGAAGGIGLALVKRYVGAGHEVIAVCRDPGPELPKLDCQLVSAADLSSPAGLHSVCAAVGARHLDVLIHNAGLLHREGLGDLRAHVGHMRAQFEINALAPLLLTEALLANLGQGSKIALITSRMGSVADNSSGGYYGYRMSKAALNSAGRSLSIDLKPRGIAVALLHPGYVRTPMTGGNGDIDPDNAAQQLIERIDALDIGNSGSFWHARGVDLPW